MTLLLLPVCLQSCRYVTKLLLLFLMSTLLLMFLLLFNVTVLQLTNKSS